MDERRDEAQAGAVLLAPALAAVERGRWWPEGTLEARGLRTLSSVMPPLAVATILALVDQLARADAAPPEPLDTADPQGWAPHDGSASDG